MTDDSDFARRHEVVALRREVRVLTARVDQLCRRRENVDVRLGPLLAMILPFTFGKPWTVAELFEYSRLGDRNLWWALDAVVGDCGDPAKRLGRWLQRHEGIDADGLRLERIARENGSWLYRIGESGELEA